MVLVKMIFVDREEELSWLIRLYEAKKRGANYNALIYGLRRIGKTSLLKAFISRVNGYYFNLAHITSERELLNILDSLGVRSQYKMGVEAIRDFFRGFGELAERKGDVIAVALDEFHVLVENLSQSIASREREKVSRIQEKIFWLIKAMVEKINNVFWVFSTSLSWHLIERGKEPARKAFLALFSTRKIRPLNREASIQLATFLASLFNKSLPEVEAEKIYELSGGIPALIEILVERVVTSNKSIEEVVEELAKSRELSDFFEAIIGFILEIIPYSRSTVLKVLKYLAQGLSSPSQIAEVEKISYTTVYNLLETLARTEIIKKVSDNGVHYYIAYPMMKPWLLSLVPEPQIVEKKLRYSLGIMFESYVKELLERLSLLKQPLEIPDPKGILTAGTWEKIRILPVSTVERPKGDPSIQVDFIAVGRLGKFEEVYIIETKYTYAPIDKEEIEKFAKRIETLREKARKRNIVAILIQGGEGGIAPEAAVYATKNNIKIITRYGLEKLAKKLNLPPP